MSLSYVPGYCFRNFFDEICPEYTHLLMKHNWYLDTILLTKTHMNKSRFLTEIHNVKCLHIFSMRKYSQLFAKFSNVINLDMNQMQLDCFWKCLSVEQFWFFNSFFFKVIKFSIRHIQSIQRILIYKQTYLKAENSDNSFLTEKQR